MPTICLVALNSAWYQSNPALYYLREILRGLPYRVRLLEFTLEEVPESVLAAIFRSRPDILCFSAYIWNKSCLQQLLPELKKLLPQTRIMVGGPEALQSDWGLGAQDFVVNGPGEGVLRSLAEAGFLQPGGVYASAAPPLRELPFPYRRSDRSALAGKLVYYECSRGCPFRCVYCLSALDQRQEQRFDPSLSQDRRRLFRELDRLVALSPRTLKFVDRSFNTQPGLARLIWEYAICCGAPCEFHFEIFPDLLNPEDLLLLEKAPPGRIRFEIGVQTVNASVSKACRRPSNWLLVKPILRALRERTAICLHLDLLAGLPGEKIPSILHSLNEVASVFPHEIQLGMLKILPGTPMRDIALQRGYAWMDAPPYQILATDTLGFTQISRLQELARIVNLYWNKGEFSQEWQNLLASGQIAAPLFQKLLLYHHRHSLPLHSISRQKRSEVFQNAILA